MDLQELLKMLSPALAMLAATEVYFWHLHGVLCLVFAVAAALLHVEAYRPRPHVLNITGVPAIVRHMNKTLARSADQMDSIISLLDLTRSSAPDRMEKLHEVVREKGVHAICEAIVQHPEEGPCVVPAYQMLQRLLSFKEVKKEVIQAFNVDSLMGSVVAPMRLWYARNQHATKESPPDATLLARGLAVIGLLVDSEGLDMQDGAAELHIPELAINGLDVCAKFPDALAQLAPYAMRALFHTCFRHGENKHLLCIEVDGLRVLVRTLALLPKVMEVQLNGIGLLYDCLQEVPRTQMPLLRRLVVDEGTVEVLDTAIKQHAGVETIVQSATQIKKLLEEVGGSVERCEPDSAGPLVGDGDQLRQRGLRGRGTMDDSRSIEI